MSLRAENLTLHRGRVPILQDVALHIPTGQITGVIGPNGVGKSSLLHALAGLAPSTGRISFDGASIGAAGRRDLIAYMPQDTSASSSLTLIEVVLLGRLGTLGLRVPGALIIEAGRALDAFGLGALAHRTLDAVSGGQRQLTFLAQALFRAPGVLMLDEPTAALDLRHQLVVLETVRGLVRGGDMAAVIALHDLTLAAQFCDHLICLSDGRVDAAGPPAKVLTVERMARVYGVKADIQPCPQAGLRITALSAL